MKTKAIMYFVGAGIALLLFVAAFWCLAPRKWPLPDGSVTIGKTNLAGKVFLVIDGEGMNYLNHFQILSVSLGSKEIHVERFAIRLAPWARATVNQQFPLFIPMEKFSTGQVEVLVHSRSSLERHQLTLP